MILVISFSNSHLLSSFFICTPLTHSVPSILNWAVLFLKSPRKGNYRLSTARKMLTGGNIHSYGRICHSGTPIHACTHGLDIDLCPGAFFVNAIPFLLVISTGASRTTAVVNK